MSPQLLMTTPKLYYVLKSAATHEVLCQLDVESKPIQIGGTFYPVHNWTQAISALTCLDPDLKMDQVRNKTIEDSMLINLGDKS